MSGKTKKMITTLLLLVIVIGLSAYYIQDNLPVFRSIFMKKDVSSSSNINVNDFKNVFDVRMAAKSKETVSFGEEATEDEDELIGQKIEIGDIPNLYDVKDFTMDSLIFTINEYYFTDGMPDEIPEERRIVRENYFNRYYTDEEDGSLPKIKCLVVDMDAYNPNEKTVLFLWNSFEVCMINDEGQMVWYNSLEYMSNPYSMGTDMFHCVIESGQTVSQRLYFPYLEKFMEGNQAGLLADFRGSLQWRQSGNAPIIMLDKERTR